MATQLFLRNSVADTHLGTNNVNLRSTSLPWVNWALSTSRGSSSAAYDTDTITGTTPGIEMDYTVVPGVTPFAWLSPPVSADVTISGTVTCNIWAAENNMSANVAINVVVDVVRANALGTANSNTIVEIGRSARVIEVAVTTRAVNNFTFTPTSTVVNRGDRLRVRVFADDVGTMATGYIWTVSMNGPTAAADGDSYVSFTENITFESAPGVWEQTPNLVAVSVGTAVTNEAYAAAFTATAANLTEARFWLGKTGSPSDNLVLEIRSDSAGSPTGSVVGTIATVSGASLTTTATQYTYSCSVTLTPATTYWIVARRDGATDAANYYLIGRTTVSGLSILRLNTGAWGSAYGDSFFTVRLAFAVSTVYLTDTASAVSTASVDKEAWTSRGSGVTSIVTNTSTGWTAPVQATATAGGTVVDWFTRPLTAFTLTGMAVLNIRALESNAAANASLRCEIARVEGDGTSPTVWCSWCCAPTGTDNGELTTSEVARTINLSGDDLAISNGQRLRIRLYNEDISSAAMVTGHTVTRYYAGTSGGASGDTYITFPQTLTEYASGPYTYEKAGYGRESG